MPPAPTPPSELDALPSPPVAPGRPWARLAAAFTDRRDDDTRAGRLFRWALWVFVGTMAFSVLGTLLLQLVPAAMGIFGPYYASLVKAPTWTYMALLPVLTTLAYWRTHPKSQLAFFALWGSFVGGVAELVGTTSGIPFGVYSYTDWLGPKLLDHVPYLIPPSWYAVSLVSHDLASRLTTRRWERIGATAVFMLLWDVSLDPAMNDAFPFWNYPGGGFYYGMPASNWAGWIAVTVIIAWGYEVIGGGLRSTSRHAPLLYALNCLFPVLIALLYGLTLGAVVGVMAMAMPLLAVKARGGRLGVLLGGDDIPLAPATASPESALVDAPSVEAPR